MEQVNEKYENCPKCGSIDIEYEHSFMGEGKYVIYATCEGCKNQWEERYSITFTGTFGGV